MKAKAYAAGTVLNALATGIGSAFAIELLTEVKLEFDESLRRSVIVAGNDIKESPVADRILSVFGKKAYVEVKSEIPAGSGLGSSSAFVNALIVAAMKACDEELDAQRILAANARLSLELGISYTGAFDDAAASLLGGFVVANNVKMKLYRRDELKRYAAVLFPNFGRGKVDWKKIKEKADKIKSVIPKLIEGDYCGTMISNTRYYCELIGYPVEIAEMGWKRRICCGLSGNGPCFAAFGSKSEMEELAEIWSSFGRVEVRRVPVQPAENVIIPKSLFTTF